MSATAMWQHFLFRGHEVVVIQQWQDPFGLRMISIASAEPGDEAVAVGMAEAAFLAEATPKPAQDIISPTL